MAAESPSTPRGSRWVGAVVLGTLLTALGSGPAAGQVRDGLYRESCDGGNMSDCNLLGMMYASGEGVPRNAPEAALLFERACEGGVSAGCTNLGLLYESGAGVPSDRQRAGALFRRACVAGDERACQELEEMLAPEPAEAPVGSFRKMGIVADAVSGERLADAIVELPDLGLRLVSDASGRVDLGTLEGGLHRLNVQRAGYELVTGDIQVPGEPEFVVLMPRAPVEDPTMPGRIVGRVTEEGDSRGLTDVDVTIVGSVGLRAITDSRGRFVLPEVEPGLVELRLARLGYETRQARFIVHPGLTAELEATMSTRPIELDAMEVTVRSRYLERTGFYRRADRGQGRHFDRSALDELDPIWTSDIFWRIPGVHVDFGTRGARVVSRRRRGLRGEPCVLRVWVDGMPSQWDTENIDMLSPHEIEAIEVYNGVSAPAQYSYGSSCGVILVWTRRGA